MSDLTRSSIRAPDFPEKLDWMNQQYILRLSPAELGSRLEPYLREAGLWRDEFATDRGAWYLALVELFKPRLTRLTKFAEEAGPFLTAEIVTEESAARKYLKPELAMPLQELRSTFEGLDPFTTAATEPAPIIRPPRPWSIICRAAAW